MSDIYKDNAQAMQSAMSEGLPVPPSAVRDPLPTPTDQPETPGEPGRPATPVSTGTSGDAEGKGEFVQFAHEYIREYIRLADQKATFFFTGSTALLAFLYNKGISVRWLKPPMTWNILDAVAFIAMIGLAVGAFLSLLVVIPRTRGSRRGFLFWEAVAEYETGRQYADELWMLSAATLFRVKADHCFDLARVCRRKYKILRVSLWSGTIGLAGSLFVFLFL